MSTNTFYIGRIGVLLGLLLAGPALAVDFQGANEIRTRTLDNGMKIIVWPDHDIPNVAMYNWVRAGGRNEYPGITGLAHFFEHMMFNGTSTLEPGEFDRIMEAAGGSNNAYTSSDLTVYQDWFPAAALETIFYLESDRLANLSFDEKVVESERGVVFSERRSSVDNDNTGMLFEQLRGTAFIAHPYQFPVIGFPSDIENWEMEDLKSFYTTYYAPNNCTLVVAGDVEPEEIFALAARTLGQIPAQAPPANLRTVEPAQQGERRLVVNREVQTPLLQVAYKSPAAADPTSPALNLLLSILTEGNSSRLHRALVEQAQVAISVGHYRHEGFDPGAVYFFATLPAGGEVEKVEELLYAQLREVAANGVTDAELAKARNAVAANFWRGLATINGKAAALGEFEVFHGDFRKLFDAPGVYAAVTADAVRDAARQAFDQNRRTVAIMRSPAAPAAGGGQ